MRLYPRGFDRCILPNAERNLKPKGKSGRSDRIEYDKTTQYI